MVIEGLMNVFGDPLVILFIAIGVIVGIIFGSIPGLTATMAIVMFLPVTYRHSGLRIAAQHRLQQRNIRFKLLQTKRGDGIG